MAVDWSDSRIFRLNIEFSSRGQVFDSKVGQGRVKSGGVRVIIERLDSPFHVLLWSFRLICKIQK